MSANGSLRQHPSRHPHCDLPGDPSLILTTNVDLGDDKLAIMKELSSLVAKVTGKPESYVGECGCTVCITDNASMLFGGSCLYSLGGIDRANNGKVQAGVTDVFEKRGLGIAQDRIYINFFDMPRECVGWNRATFAG
ncbi:hypothetical protein ACHAW5_005385 [Stephanodiscus triporus]|uniref:L-dopachrome isomerase n=1 Tax=Stephanodiscus triporus TaxID=2934178 RepID=A0ABD3P6H6_9STRA